MTTTTAVLHTLADHLDQQPNRVCDMPAIRGKARALGLTDEWIGVLPYPDGAHHSEYANRLRTLAGGS